MNEKKLEEKPKQREYPCPECDDGELEYIYSTPNQFGQTMVYECNNCGYKISFP